ncbi:sensor histidine kinase [Pseudactinotalea sp. Z1739]|uniref:sensor histidine kinase n=1 Tax=Pseudactinotalea sp. Z1739 TaxID=3413028 RepID=UPI003C7DAAB9
MTHADHQRQGLPHPGAAALIRPTRPRSSDVILAIGAFLLLGPLTYGLAGGVGPTTVAAGLGAVVASVAMPGALAWRRSHPAISAIVVYSGALLHFATGTPLLPADVLIFAALYSVTVYGPRWARLAGLGGALLGCLLLAVASMTFYGSMSLAELDTESILTGGISFALPAALVLAVWALALVRKARVQQLESFAERALRLEIERDQQAQIATAAERARIAREMHDVVAHSLAVVISQADGGRYAAAGDPGAAEAALSTIAESGRTALADLRRILGVLREGGAGPEFVPQPGTDDLDTLLTPVRQAGLQVSLERSGTPRPVPASTGLSVYRIVQESLTNVLKHAGPGAQVRVHLGWHPTHLEVWVIDDGYGAAAPPGGGHGLSGMRERATMAGGDLTAGPGPTGGWQVHARLPVPPAPASGQPPGARPAAQTEQERR